MIKIAITGKQCSGKTTVTNLILKHFSHHRILKFAQPLYDILGVLGQPKHRAFMQEHSDLAKKHFGPMVFNDIFKRELGYMEKAFLPPDIVVCDDMRFQHELNTVKEAGFLTLYVAAKACDSEERAKAQGLEYLPNHNSEIEIDSLKDQCDIILWNVGTMADLEQSVQVFMESLKEWVRGAQRPS